MTPWSDTKVIVTGGAGFLGSVVSRKLRERGVQEIVAPRSRDVDLTQRDQVRDLLAAERPDMIFHLAARVGGIGANMQRPAQIYIDNLLMGTFVIEEARLAGVPKTVIVGTICAYPKFAPAPFAETSLWDGYPEETNAPYGVAKKALLVHAQANRAQHGQNCIYLLPTNLYGPGDKFNPNVSHVIPALIKKCVDARDEGAAYIDVWGTGRATREFIYVDDAAEGIVLGAERYDGSDPVNLGSGQEVSIKDLAETIARLAGFEGELRWDPSKPDGQPRRLVDSSKAEKEFGFTAAMPLETGIERTIRWYEANRDVAELATL